MRRGQVSLEFMFIFSIIAILLVYSINNTTFKQGSASVDTMTVQVALEGKHVINTISGTISQVYSQGPGSKATTYVSVSYLSDKDMLLKTFNSSNITITQVGTNVSITIGDKAITTGDKKNTFTTTTIYNTPHKDSISISAFPRILKIVVQWNPDLNESWSFDPTNGELDININPGG
ncbi:class III signal peptide-containing protein [Thermococcus sp. Bubb.Bath]|uniref:class III signal peptide-containing protein n=1 Tax=Thermococcus sp. Bubb.Bath TaxID=1638242 RepID=UPI00143A6F39|nr:class III signal peptide-containing protein [Thermococcus sp. Bubb.Bath]NJF25537.1 class III signal peptide-containing protein [Thermococcus sp. Bubb.Bath]